MMPGAGWGLLVAAAIAPASVFAAPLTHGWDCIACDTNSMLAANFGSRRAQSKCRLVLPLIHFIPDSQACSVYSISETTMRPNPRQQPPDVRLQSHRPVVGRGRRQPLRRARAVELLRRREVQRQRHEPNGGRGPGAEEGQPEDEGPRLRGRRPRTAHPLRPARDPGPPRARAHCRLLYQAVHPLYTRLTDIFGFRYLYF